MKPQDNGPAGGDVGSGRSDAPDGQIAQQDEPDEKSTPELDPKIAHHGAYIDETKLLLREYRRLESFDALKERVVEENILNKSTDYYRKNILREVARRYIPDTETYTTTPLMRVLDANLRDDVENWCLYYEFAQDPFIRLVTIEYLYPEFEKGTLSVRSEEVVEYLEDIQNEYRGMRDRTETTIEEAASKYLAAMKNYGLLEGHQRKEFAITYIPDEAIAYVVYRLFDRGVDTAAGVIEHEDWQLLLLGEEDVRRRLQDISSSYVRYEKLGSTERLERLYDDTEALTNAF